jgi:hypothetical protein
MARMICSTITRSASLFHCTAILDHVGIASILIGGKLTIRMLKSKINFAALVLAKPFLCFMIREFSISSHVPVV